MAIVEKEGWLRTPLKFVSEMVQDFPEYGENAKGFKPASELEKAVKGISNLPLVFGHETNYEIGHAGDISFEDNTGKATAYINTSRIPSEIADKIRSGETIDVSIEYEATEDWTGGNHGGEKFDFTQRDLNISAVALLPHGEGRCSVPSCGINLDKGTAGKLKYNDVLRLFSEEPKMVTKTKDQPEEVPAVAPVEGEPAVDPVAALEACQAELAKFKMKEASVAEALVATGDSKPDPRIEKYVERLRKRIGDTLPKLCTDKLKGYNFDELIAIEDGLESLGDKVPDFGVPSKPVKGSTEDLYNYRS